MIENIQSELRKYIDIDESLLWTGKPKQGIVFKSSDAFFIPFSIMWGGFAIFWESSVILTNAPFFFILWGIPFVLAGLYLIFGRFFFDSLRRKKTYYGITENRIIIKSGVFNESVKSVDIKTLSNLNMNEKPDGSGTIVFGPYFGANNFFKGTLHKNSNIKVSPAFELIPNVRKVYRQITDLQKKQ